MSHIINPAGQLLTRINLQLFLQEEKTRFLLMKKMNGNLRYTYMFKMLPLVNKLYLCCSKIMNKRDSVYCVLFAAVF